MTSLPRSRAACSAATMRVVVVAHLGLLVAGDARRGQTLTDPGRIGVDYLTEQELGPDGEDLAVHSAAALGACGCRAAHGAGVHEVLDGTGPGQYYRQPQGQMRESQPRWPRHRQQ